MEDYSNIFIQHCDRHATAIQAVSDCLVNPVVKAGCSLINSLKEGCKILICGHGGSAADAQHIAAELTGRYADENRRPLPALALSTDSSAVTAISNDMGYERVFARQVEAHGNPGDVLIGISTSGSSLNVIAAVEQAKLQGLKTIGLLGRDGGILADLVDIPLIVPSESTPHIQEMHITIGHILCAMVDRAFRP